MRSQYEVSSLQSNEIIQCRMTTEDDVPEHMHEFFEVTLVLAGNCRARVGADAFDLGPEDVLAIDAHTPHAFKGRDLVLASVQFEQAPFEALMPKPRHPSFFCNSAATPPNPAYAQLRRLIALVFKNNAEKGLGYELRNASLALQIMDVFEQSFKLDGTEAHDRRGYRHADRVGRITRLIDEHYAEPYALTDLARDVHLSAPYLSRFFRQQFHETFSAYLNQVRLQHSMRLLTLTDTTIEEISAQSGFPNSHAYVTSFKARYGSLPSVYRKTIREAQSQSPQPLIEQSDCLAKLAEYLKEPASELAPASTDASLCPVLVNGRGGGKKLRHTWRKLMGVGSARDLLSEPVRQMIRRIQREVGFEYIKFGGLLSDDMRVVIQDAAGAPTYSFAYVDSVMDFLAEVGLRPLVQLSFMPRLIARDPARQLLGDCVSEPRDLGEWCSLVAALARHLMQRYGADEVASWPWCVWNQPDTDRALYGFGSEDAFKAFYKATWEAVKGVDPRIRVGMPATFYLLHLDHENWYLPFYRWCVDAGCPPDFWNFHYYDVDLLRGGDEGGRELFGFVDTLALRTTPDGFGDFVSQVTAERIGEARELPVYVSEWNNSPSQQDWLNDTCFKSCYLVKSIAENYDALDALGYWSLTDLMGESALPPEQFFGGLGLFTKDGVPKASYYAMCLLRQLGDTLVSRGPGWFITRGRGGWQALLYNYRHFSRLYAMGERFDMTFTDRYTPFSPERDLDIRLRMEGMDDGRYLVRELSVSRSGGSAFDAWVRMGACELEGPLERELLCQASAPKLSKYEVEAQDGALEINALLEMLEVRLLQIKSA